MKRLVVLFTFIICMVSTTLEANAWGFWAHKRINRVAVFTLPPGMIGFYKHYLEYLTEHAVDPDRRRYADPEEAPRHYIDLDHYHVIPDSFPRFWDSAVKTFTEDTLKAYGIVPWVGTWTYYKLIDAFKREDRDAILRYSADLGHYVGDAHVPLHTSENYNGQMTNQNGIHGFWESRVPELFGETMTISWARPLLLIIP